MDFKNRNKTHYVYCLIKDSKPIYVGCCMDLKQREVGHRRDKIFDYIFMLKEYQNKSEALIAENAIIRFLSIQNDPSIINGKDFRLIEYIKQKELYG